jgi:hypothetical protein
LACITETETWNSKTAQEVLAQHRRFTKEADVTLQQKCFFHTDASRYDLLRKLGDCEPGVHQRQIMSSSTREIQLNAHGQTFLFSFDPKAFIPQLCSCGGIKNYEHIPTAFSFSPFIRALEQHKFDFDQLDNNGRPLLFFMYSSPFFDLRWLLELMAQDNQWDYRVGHMAQIRDATGLFLIDFMALEL